MILQIDYWGSEGGESEADHCADHTSPLVSCIPCIHAPVHMNLGEGGACMHPMGLWQVSD